MTARPTPATTRPVPVDEAPPGAHLAATPPRSTLAASRLALKGLLLRDLTVLRKNFLEFVLRTLVQPFLLVFVFLYVFPQIGQAIGGGKAGASAFATVLIPGVVGISVMFQGMQAVALQLSQEFGFTREIEDRVQAPAPIWLVAEAKVLSGTVQGVIAALIVFPIAAVVHASGVQPHWQVTWWVVVTILPLTAVTFSSLGLFLGCVFEPRNIGLMFGFIVLPIIFLGGTYYQWTALSSVQVGGFPWLQALVCLNPLIYVTEGLRAGLTSLSHMPLAAVYPALLASWALFVVLGLRAFRGRVLS